MKSSEKTYRTLIRVHSVDQNLLAVIIPGWDASTPVHLDLLGVPEEVKKIAVPGRRFHARVNIGAELAKDLHFADWELE